MKIGGILVCRMDSQRMPGKVLQPIAGQPLLQYVLRRCRRMPSWSGPDASNLVILATTDRAVDDPLEQFATEQGLPIYRGSVHNVAHRVLKCAELHGLDAFVRLNGDSPWIDPQLIESGLHEMRNGTWQFVTNLQPRSFPYGVSLEVIRTSFFASMYSRMTMAGHFEHVTKYLYEHYSRDHCCNLRRAGGPSADITRWRLTVDTPEDFERFESVVHRYGPDVHRLDWQEVLSAYDPAQNIRKAA